LIGLESYVDGEPCECPYCESVFVPATQTAPGQTTAAVIPLDDADPDIPSEPRSWFEQPRFVWSAAALLAALTLAALWFGNPATKVFAFILSLSVLNGYWLGAARVTSLLIGMLIAATLAVPLGKLFEGVSGYLTGTSGLANRMLSVGIMAILVTAAATPGFHILVTWLMQEKLNAPAADKPLGAVIGSLQGTLLGFLVLWSILAIQPVAATAVAVRQPGAAENRAAVKFVELGESVRQSLVGHVAETVNPMSDLRLLTLLQKALRVLNDPAARDKMARHEAIAAIKDLPSVKQAAEMIKADQRLMAMLSAEDGVSADELREILDSPTILKILDETSIAADVGPMSDRIEEAIDAAAAGHPE
jgi:hypothetical protein